MRPRAAAPPAAQRLERDQRQPVVAAALLPTLPVTAEFVVEELLPKVAELSTPVAGAAPIAVVPVDGVVLTLLPGVLGPARLAEALPETVPGVFVLATLPVDGDAGVALDGPALPTVDEPSVDEPSVEDGSVDESELEPHGAATPGLGFCANAEPAQATTAPATNSCASDFMMGSP